MSKDITAMQQLLEYADKIPFGSITGLSYIRHKIRELLEAEREQIIDAYTKGQLDIVNLVGSHIPALIEYIDIEEDQEDGKDYYNQTYKTDTNG